jgi:hypothetical protein
MLLETAVVIELILVHEYIVADLLTTHTAHSEPIHNSRPLCVEGQAVLGKVSLKNSHRVVAHHKQSFLVRVLFLSVEGVTEKDLDVAVLIVGETALVFQYSKDLLTFL